MFILFAIVHVIVSVFLILVILLQSGKAGDLASAFGGAGSQTAFGARSAATVLTKATTICAILFMVTSLGLAIMFNQARSGSIIEQVPYSEPAAETAAPEAGAPETTAPETTGSETKTQESAAPAEQPSKPAEQPGRN